MSESLFGVPVKELGELSRKAIPEGMILLKNDKNALPILKDEHVAIFGRCAIDFYKSGTGSGGSVNVPYNINLIEGLSSNHCLMDNEILDYYRSFIEETKDLCSAGWTESSHKPELVLDEEIISRASKRNDKAIVVIGRTAGEDADYTETEGSILLTNDEKLLLNRVIKYFDKTIVVLNVSNIINMKYLVKEIEKKPEAIIYAWQGGMEGGNGVADALMGVTSPSGKLTDTITYDAKDFPSDKYYHNERDLFYNEDIYVGYRYFNTFKKDRIIYPFGYGLTYSEFKYEVKSASYDNDYISLKVLVKNVGSYKAKEVIQVYSEALNSVLGQPSRILIGFKKTKELMPNEEEVLEFKLSMDLLKTYDDSGLTGHKSSYIIEKGGYNIYVGNSSLNNAKVSFDKDIYFNEARVVEELTEAGAPTQAFERIKNVNGKIEYEAVPLRTINLKERILNNLPKEIPYTGYKGIKLIDVKNGKASMDEFIAQLDDRHLAMLVRGEGMANPNVTPGIGSCYGGLSMDLVKDYGIPIFQTADGPSGIRLDSGIHASQLPICSLLASSFNPDMVEELFYHIGRELKRDNIDILLGPGINIHRHPLCGRNFEYYSEDPLLTGKMAASVSRGLNKAGAIATAKHLCCNNRELDRYSTNSIISERALREIYLRGFEIAVKEGGLKSLMTSYNLVNGYYAQNNYDTLTTIVRGEWGFTGMVMTDWWARNNNVITGELNDYQDLASMIRAQNDIYMIVQNYGAEINIDNDNILSSIENGSLTRGELQRSVKNILNISINTFNMERGCSHITPYRTVKPSDKGEYLEAGVYNLYIDLVNNEGVLAQSNINIYLNDEFMISLQSEGTDGKVVRRSALKLEVKAGHYSFSYKVGKAGLEIVGHEFEKLN